MEDVTYSIEVLNQLDPAGIAVEGIYAALGDPDHDDERRLTIRGEVQAAGGLSSDIELLLLVNDGAGRLIATANQRIWRENFNSFDVFDLWTYLPAGLTADRIRLVVRPG